VLDLTIAYGGISPKFDAPGDRRRFSGFSTRQDLKIGSLTQESKVDVAVMTLGFDISTWKSLRKRNGKIVLDIVDSYLDESKMSMQRQLRGTYKSLKRELSVPHLRYTELLKRVIENVDVVVCASLEQKKTLEEFNANVHVIVDCFDEVIEDTLNQRTQYFPKKILWEGMADNLWHLQLLQLTKDDPELIVLTSPEMRKRLRPTRAKSTNEYMSSLHIDGIVKPWNLENLKQFGQECAFAVIPINSSNPMAWNKSENKLLGLWALGIPTFVSPTPSYTRVLLDAQLPECLVSDAEWRDVILELSCDQSNLNRIAQIGRTYALSRVRGNVLDPLWKDALGSSGLNISLVSVND
jgi:hypothetical protein